MSFCAENKDMQLKQKKSAEKVMRFFGRLFYRAFGI